MKNLLAKYNRLENNNDHNKCALLLVKNFGTQEEVDRIMEIFSNHTKRGHILYEEQQERFKISNKYYELLHKATK